MYGKLWLGFLLISALFLACAEVVAQDQQVNIACINRYYHNWQDGVYDVAIQGNYAFLACGQEGFRVLDLSAAEGVRDIAHLALPSWANVVAVAGSYVYVGTSWTGGLYVIDVSNPAAPVQVRYTPFEATFNHIRIFGDYAFVCVSDHHSSGGLLIWDISNPASPQTVWNGWGVSNVGDVELRGNMLYVADGWDGLEVYDVSDMASPQYLSSFSNHDGEWVTGVALSGNYAFLSCGWDGLRVVDLSSMQMVADIDSLRYAFGIEVVENHAYVNYGDPECPLAVVDISNPLSPQTTGIYHPLQDIARFTLDGNLAYISDRRNGLRMVDIADATNPHETACYSRYGIDLGVTLSGSTAYVREDLKIKAVDISDPLHPQELSFYEVGWPYTDLQISGNVAYLIRDWYDCVTAIDLSDPANLHAIGTFTSQTDVHGAAAVQGQYLYMLDSYGLSVVDVSDPTHMIEAGSVGINMPNGRLAVSGRYLFAQGGQRLAAYDLSDPTSPQFIADCPFGPPWAMQMRADNGRLYVLTRDELMTFDVSNFTGWTGALSTTTVSRSDTGETAVSLAVSGNYVYVTGSNIGLNVYDASNPHALRLVGHTGVPQAGCGVAANGPLVVVADGDNLGFYNCSQVLAGGKSGEATTPQRFALLPNYPNPFNSSTQIVFELPRAEHVQLQVYNALGQMVTTLIDEARPAGSYRVAWDGRSQNGLQAASGLYICRMEAGGFNASHKLLLTR